MEYRPDWRAGHEYCIVCNAEAPEQVSGRSCPNPACYANGISPESEESSTHFYCRTCGQCSERRVFLDTLMTYGNEPDGKLWHESVGVFVRNPDGRFLFYRRTVYPAGALTVPSGHVDAGESPEKAAVRELAEEVSIKAVSITANQIAPVATDDIDSDSCRRGSDDHRWHTFLLILDSPIDLEDVTVSHEGREPAWLTLEQASRAKKLTRPVQYVIDHHAADLKR